jgi:four helix bundle protein
MESRTQNKKPAFDLEERLIQYSLLIIELVELLPNTIIGRHFSSQLIRSGTAPAFNYAEAQSAESRKDFIHKMKISLKELRESHVCLKIIQRKQLIRDQRLAVKAIKENDELISIFVKSISTARANLRKGS